MNRQFSRRFLMRALACGGAASLVSLKTLWQSASASNASDALSQIDSHTQVKPTQGRRILRHELEADRF